MDTLRNCCEREIFDTLILKRFEDTEFFIPERYDERLKKLFKDYMTPPPENERRGHHGIVKIDFGKYKKL
jgi:phosphorylcholine metabolism protein LicD